MSSFKPLTKEEEYGNWVLDDKSTWSCKCSMLDECRGPPDGLCNGPYGEEDKPQ